MIMNISNDMTDSDFLAEMTTFACFRLICVVGTRLKHKTVPALVQDYNGEYDGLKRFGDSHMYHIQMHTTTTRPQSSGQIISE